MIDPWGLVIVLAIGCAYLIWYGLRMGWRLHQEQIEVAIQRDYARQWRENYEIAERRLAAHERAISVTVSAEDKISPVLTRLKIRIKEAMEEMTRNAEPARPILAVTNPEQFATEFKEGCVAPDGSIWATPTVRYGSGALAVAEGEREKAEMFGWTWHGWDPKSQLDIMRRA